MNLDQMGAQELIAATLAENYLMFGFADDGEADKVAGRVVEVLAAMGWKIAKAKRLAQLEALEALALMPEDN